MAIRCEVNGKVIVSAGKTYTLPESLRDMAGQESEGVERLMAEVMEEAFGELKEGERVIDVNSGFFTKNMTTHFWVVVVAEKGDEEGVSRAAFAAASES